LVGTDEVVGYRLDESVGCTTCDIVGYSLLLMGRWLLNMW